MVMHVNHRLDIGLEPSLPIRDGLCSQNDGKGEEKHEKTKQDHAGKQKTVFEIDTIQRRIVPICWQ